MSAGDSFNGLKVMVIDDSNTIRRSAEIFLGKTGASVVLAEDGFDALAKIADHQPDLIFCDVMMPRLDGYQTCALIKKSPKFKTTPVVMLSSKDGLFDKAKGRMVGSDHYLTKPFTKDSLLQAVAGYARRSPVADVQPVQAMSPETPAPVATATPGPAPEHEFELSTDSGLNLSADIGQMLREFPEPTLDLIDPAENFTLSLV